MTAAARSAVARYAAAVRNARSCEAATEPRCRCFCGGRAHGRSHRAELAVHRDVIVQECGDAPPAWSQLDLGVAVRPRNTER